MMITAVRWLLGWRRKTTRVESAQDGQDVVCPPPYVPDAYSAAGDASDHFPPWRPRSRT